MLGEAVNAASLIVTGGAVAFALAVALWSYRLTQGVRAAHGRWRERARIVEEKLDRADAILGAHPGVVLVWEDDDPDEAAAWGSPKVFGSPVALASLLRFVDASDGPELAARILDGLADYDARDGRDETTTLRRRLADLRSDGGVFTLRIAGPAGRYLEADGRPAGRRVVLWLVDSTIKGIEESSAQGRLDEPSTQMAHDPAAFFDMLAKAPFPVWRLSSGAKLQWGNQAYLDAVESDTLDAAVRKDIAFDPGLKEQANKALRLGARVDDTRAVVADGARRHYAVSVFPVSGGAAAVAVDMTRAEDAREALELQMRAQDKALDHVDDGVVIFSPKQDVTFHNAAFANLFGVDRDWLDEGPSHGALLDHLRERDLVPERADYPQWKERELARYGEAEGETPEETWQLPSGRILRVARLRHPLGGFLMIFGDMTDSVILESDYNTLIKVQRATLDKLTEGVAVFGADGLLQLHNRAFEEMWQLAPEAFDDEVSFDDISTACLPLFHDRDNWAEMKARVTDTSPAARQQAFGEIQRSDASVLNYVSRPLPDGATVIAFSNVTAERQLANAMEDKAAAFVQADKVKSDFVTHVSYQLRAPLQTILGYAELLRRSLGEELPEREAGQLGSILEAVGQLNKLVEDILDIAAIEADTLELDIAAMDVRAALEAGVGVVQTRTGNSDVRIVVECPDDIVEARADIKRIRQIVYNLVLNGVQHSQPGQTVTAGAARDGAALCIWVQDEGAGIAQEDQARLFAPFERGRSGGAGLGLALVREFVEMHRGWVDLESEPGSGTRVTCYFPDAVGVGEPAPEPDTVA